MRLLELVRIWATRCVAAYVVCWHAALAVVLAWDGLLTTPGVSLAALAREYARALPALLFRPGGELATYTQVLAIMLAGVAFAGYLAWREWGPSRVAGRAGGRAGRPREAPR